MTGSVLDSVRKTAHLAWWALLLRGLLSVAVGVFIFARPLEGVAAFALVIAIWALFSGFVGIVHAFELKPVTTHWWVVLLSGLVGVGFGIFALMYYPVPSLAFAVIWVSWLLTITGAIEIFAAVQEKQMGMPWGGTAAFGVLSVVAGVFALIAPPITLAAIIGLIAGFAILAGAVQLMAAYTLRGLVRS
ncbi:MAG TPA: DUF308 domain-containing protein [Gemmatimonadales bacterium]|jgi:uncharacterized membrane protein HdeD (DUF308 family)